jgi:hypothetical protein
MLMPLNRIAAEIQIEETEAHRVAIYGNLQRRAGFYDDRDFLRAYVKILHERLRSHGPSETHDYEPRLPRWTNDPKKRVRRATRKRTFKTPWEGPTRRKIRTDGKSRD